MKQQSKQNIHRIHKESGMAGMNEKFRAGENLCMLSAMFNAMDKKLLRGVFAAKLNVCQP